MKTIKKTFLISILSALLLILNTAMISADESYSWYTVPTKDGKQPDSFPAKAILEKYGALYLGNKDEKTVYLTFDAGYENGNVEKVLDALKKNDVRAAFFVLPHLIKSSPDLVKRMAQDGHIVCNHTYSHGDMSKISDIEKFQRELNDLESVYKEYTGLDMSKYYRPPEGRFSELNLEFADKLGYKTVFWSLAYADWDNNKQQSPEKAIQTIMSRLHNGCIILLHPTSETNAAIMDDVIKQIKECGYRFGTLDEL